MKKKDLIVVIFIILLAVGLVFLKPLLDKAKVPNAAIAQNNEATSEKTDENVKNNSSANNSSDKDSNKSIEKDSDKNNEKPNASKDIPEFVEADAYLSVQMGSVLYAPQPLIDDEKEMTITQGKQENTLLLTRRSIVMKHSNCDTQDCVHQGMVSLENIDERVLSDAIICLPHKLVIRLLKPDEAKRQFESIYGKTEKTK